MRINWWAGVLVALLPAPLAAQSLAQRVQGAGDGTVRLSFASREGVCSRGPGSITIIDDHDDSDDDEWESDCERGPVRVSLRMQGGRVADSETYVGGRWRAGRGRVTDLGLVPAREAADLLLSLAPRASDDDGELITAATLADSAEVWPQLLRIARNPDIGEETRRQAVFWLGQAAGDAATEGLDSIARDGDGDIEIRKQAVFALSQRPSDEGVPVLIRIARTNRHPELRKTALFWLGQSEDPRALTLFEEILR
ncbi:MAG: HEAT repeat domain-containing protein [Gemmatimonadales bacterium]|nr:HEAT repeat domain-containing protein [Gemmatimonadales bacterium]